MIQTILIAEIFKVAFLLIMKTVIVKAGFLGKKFEGVSKTWTNAIESIFGVDEAKSSPTSATSDTSILPYSQRNDRSEEKSALITGLIQLVVTLVGCLIVKNTFASLTSNLKNALQSSLPTSYPHRVNLTQYLLPNTTLNSFELQILDEAVVLPSSASGDFSQIGGLATTKDALIDLADDFLLFDYLGSSDTVGDKSKKTPSTVSNLYQPVSGILFHGPPGE